MWCDPKAILCEIHQCFKSFLEVCELCWEHPLEYCPRQARGEAHRESKTCCYLGTLQKGGKFACNKETNFRIIERSLFWTPVGIDRKGEKWWIFLKKKFFWKPFKSWWAEKQGNRTGWDNKVYPTRIRLERSDPCSNPLSTLSQYTCSTLF